MLGSIVKFKTCYPMSFLPNNGVSTICIIPWCHSSSGFTPDAVSGICQ